MTNWPSAVDPKSLQFNVPCMFCICYPPTMSRFPFLHFIPVPVRPRSDGWTPVLQTRFIIGIAKGLSPARAAARIGKTRQSALALRKHRDGRSFAAAWDSARRFSEERRAGGAALRSAGPP
jgi:hypothetical protein